LYKELYLFHQNRPVKALIRNYEKKDIPGLIDLQKQCFPPPFPSELWWNEKQLNNHISLFPDGALCAEINNTIVGSITGLIVKYDPQDPNHNWADTTDHGYIRNHDPNGDTLYIVDISVSPDYRKLGIGKWLMQSMYETVVQKGLTRLLGGGRMPGYHFYSKDLSATEYLEKVLQGELQDPVISFLLRCGRTPVKVVENYLEDEESLNHAVLMEWKNPFLTAGNSR